MRSRTAVPAVIVILAAAFLAVRVAASQQTAPSNVVNKTINAIGYQVGGGKTTIDFKGTGLQPASSGKADIEAKKGITEIKAEFRYLAQPTKFGAEFLTYVLWAVSPDGSANNLGELVLDKNGNSKLKASTQLSMFSLLVTAEPYFAVSRPSEVVVLENSLRKSTKGRIFPVDNYALLKKAQYQKLGNPLALTLDLKNVPLDMYEARNAVDIARSHEAGKYAPEIFTKAEGALKIAEKALASRANKKEIASRAREAVQFAEDARSLTVQRQEQERIAEEREAAAAKARAEAQAKADAEARRQAELAAAREARMKAEAEAAALRAKAEADAAARKAKAEADAAALKAKAEADAAALKAKEEADALRAKEEAAKAEAEGARRAAEALRAQLLDQFNRVLETRDTPRGLVANMADVLFDTGKYNLRPLAREKLARFAGIVLAHPGLDLEVEGHTDSTGSDEFNQTLSEQRGAAVREYLIEQGLPAANISSRGFGKTMPVADNSTAEGRQKNRRVEIIVSGEVIGTDIGVIRR
jgi:outer membrane protein OmpA-like peptidoglycan-associated protein